MKIIKYLKHIHNVTIGRFLLHRAIKIWCNSFITYKKCQPLIEWGYVPKYSGKKLNPPKNILAGVPNKCQ